MDELKKVAELGLREIAKDVLTQMGYSNTQAHVNYEPMFTALQKVQREAEEYWRDIAQADKDLADTRYAKGQRDTARECADIVRAGLPALDGEDVANAIKQRFLKGE